MKREVWPGRMVVPECAADAPARCLRARCRTTLTVSERSHESRAIAGSRVGCISRITLAQRSLTTPPSYWRHLGSKANVSGRRRVLRLRSIVPLTIPGTSGVEACNDARSLPSS